MSFHDYTFKQHVVSTATFNRRVTLLRYVVAYDVHDAERPREPKTRLDFVYCANEAEMAVAKANAENDTNRLPDSVVDVITVVEVMIFFDVRSSSNI